MRADARGGVDLPHRRLAPELAHHDVLADAGEAELGDQRDSDACGDEALHGVVVVGLEGDPRVVPGARAGLVDQAFALAVGPAADPRLVGEIA